MTSSDPFLGADTDAAETVSARATAGTSSMRIGFVESHAPTNDIATSAT